MEGGYWLYNTNKNYKKYKSNEITQTQFFGHTVADGVSGVCTVAGTSIGAVVGSVFGPGLGNIAGGIVGGGAGKVVGWAAGGFIKLFTG